MKTCTIEGCTNRHEARGWCVKHWTRWSRYGDPLGTAPLPAKKTCNIEGCDRDSVARGMCKAHWERWSKHGNPLQGGPIGLRASSPAEAFSARTERQGDCLIWTGACNPGGYGQLSVNGRKVAAHRYAYEVAHGPIPDGLYVDHTCWNRRCVEVTHLRTATHQQNQQNLSGVRSGRDLPRGVYRDKRREGYYAQVAHNRRTLRLGTFPTVKEAAEAAAAKRLELFGEFAGK